MQARACVWASGWLRTDRSVITLSPPHYHEVIPYLLHSSSRVVPAYKIDVEVLTAHAKVMFKIPIQSVLTFPQGLVLHYVGSRL